MGLVPLGLLLAVVVTVAIGTAVVRRSPPSREAAVAAGRAHAVHSAGAALLLGLLAAGYVGATKLGNGSPGGLGVTALLIPITFGVVHTLVLAVGELTWPRPEGEVRRARLVHRGLLDAAPRWLVRMAAVAGRAGRRHARRRRPPGRRRRPERHLRGPVRGAAWPPPARSPARSTALPAGIGLLVLALVTAVTLWIVANRPAVATADDGIESALRRASAHRVLRVAVGVPLFVTGGLLFVGGSGTALGGHQHRLVRAAGGGRRLRRP